jgi:hypothetical protein
MTDSIQVLKPGVRFTNSAGAVLSGAILYFFETDGVTPKIVYSDFARADPVGTSVTADSGGYPTSDGSTKCELYVGPGNYDAELRSSAGVVQWSFQDIQGAIDTSGFLTTSDGVTPSLPVVNTTSNQALGVSSKGKKYNTNCTGGDLTHTCGDAATLEDGWYVDIRHDGTANQVKITGTSGQLFKIPGRAGVTGFALTRRGQGVRISCDETGFVVDELASGLFNTTGIILIVDRLAVPAPSPEAGDRYIVTTGPSGVWSAFTVGAIAEADGQGGWFEIIPPADCGWQAYVQDEDIYYFYVGSAWVAQSATTAREGTLRAADQAAMEALTAGRAVTADVQLYHPAHPKVRVNFNGTGTIAIREDFGAASLTDNGTADYTVNYDTAFANTSPCVLVTCGSTSTAFATIAAPAAASQRTVLETRGDSGSPADQAHMMLMAAGDH